jgi:RHS repeat-associated protein
MDLAPLRPWPMPTGKYFHYHSFGDLVGSLANPFQYTARESDPETGLHYYRARYYDTSTGRFLGEDLFTKHVASSYAYVDNQPIDFTDFSGLFPVPDCVKKLLSPYFPRLNWDLVEVHNTVPLGPGTHGFTWNSDVFITPSEYNPQTTVGISLIAHELTHVQQFQGRGTGTFLGWYGFDLFMNYYFDRNWDKAYRNVHYEKEADDVELKVTGHLLYKFGFKDPCPEEKPCGSK